MRPRTFSLALVVLALVALVGCHATPAFVRAVDATWQAVGPEYTAYVVSDPKLSDDDKTTRLRTVELMDKNIAAEMSR